MRNSQSYYKGYTDGLASKITNRDFFRLSEKTKLFHLDEECKAYQQGFEDGKRGNQYLSDAQTSSSSIYLTTFFKSKTA